MSIPFSNLTKNKKNRSTVRNRDLYQLVVFYESIPFIKQKRMEDFDFFALILLEHVKVSSSITKMK